MKVGLVYPGKRSDDIQMPLGIGYLASYILSRNNDIEVQVLDTSIATEKETRAFFNCDYDVVGISVTSRGYHEAVKIAKAFKEIKNNTLIVFGGAHVSLMKKEIMKEQLIDMAVYGEGELTFNELLRVLKETNDKATAEALSEVEGLIYRRNGEIVINPPREFIKDLDTLPFPAIHLFPIERYTGKFPMITSRGCPFACAFCASSRIWNRRWRARSARNVINEVEYILNHFGTRPIDLHDAAFNISLDRVKDICETFINKKIRVPWGVRGFRADIIDIDTAKKMHQAGCTHVAIGIESANPEMLIRIGKKETIEQIDRGINILREAGIEVLGQFMIGNPGETLETVKESIAYAQNSNLSQAVFGASAVPFPNTDLWDYVNKHGKWLVDTDCTGFEDVYPRVIFETPEFSKEDRLKAIRLVRKAGFMHDKNSLTQELYNIASGIWFNHLYGFLPRSMSYYVYFFLRKVKRIFKPVSRKIRCMPIDVIEKLRGRDSLTPPRSMISFASGGRDFKKRGKEFKKYFLDLGQLQKNDRVLDVGCGVGRMAVPLTSYLSQKGEYQGFDAVRKSIKWCQNHISPRFSNFHFQHIDIYNKVYNPNGKYLAKHLQFPYQSDYFDFVFLISVFTQMLSEDVENYMSEISRVLKPHSKCFITYFLLNNESEKLIRMGSITVDFKHKLDRGLTINESEPERSIAYDEGFIRGLYGKYGLRIIEPIHYGWWSGRDTFLSYQDILIATKE